MSDLVIVKERLIFLASLISNLIESYENNFKIKIKNQQKKKFFLTTKFSNRK